MAKINEGSFRNWNDGEIVKASDYKQEREIIRVAVNDTHDRFLDEQANFQQLKNVVEENVPKIEAFEELATDVEQKGNYALSQGDYAKGQGNAIQEALEKSVNIIKSPTIPEGIVEGRLWADTSDNTYQGTVFEELSDQLAQTETEVNFVKDTKMDKNTSNISVNQINKNLGKFDQTFMTDEFLQQMAGNTPINSVPADNSITSQKLVNGAITEEKTSFIDISPNMFDKSGMLQYKTVNEATTDNALWNPIDSVDAHRWVSPVMEIQPNVQYEFNLPITGTNRVYIFSALGRRIETQTLTAINGIFRFTTTQATARYIRLNMFDTYVDFNKFMLVKGSLPNDYWGFNEKRLRESIKIKQEARIDPLIIGKELLNTARSTILNRNVTNKFLNFGYITDVHVNEPANYTENNLELFKRFSNEKFLDFSSFGGDMFTSYAGMPRTDALQIIGKVTGVFGDIQIPMYNVIGNHELNAKLKDGSGNYDNSQSVSNNQLYALLQLNAPKGKANFNTNDSRGLYFYNDFEHEKIRVIVLNNYDERVGENSGIHSTQLQWLSDHALKFTSKANPTEWTVIILTHYEPTGSPLIAFNKLINAYKDGTATSHNDPSKDLVFNADFTQQGTMKLVGLIRGHQHSDSLDTSNGYNIIGVAAGYCSLSEIGTPNEYRFSVFTIDTVNRKLHETRIGKGSNREFSY